MTSRDELQPPWTVALGPGERCERLTPLLRALPAPPGARLALWTDLSEGLELTAGRGRVLVDADGLPAEDIGLLRRMVERSAGFEWILTGSGAPAGALAALLPLARVRWWPWPLDVEVLPRLLERPSLLAAPARHPHPLQRAATLERESIPVARPDQELEVIEALLSGQAEALPAGPPPPRTTPDLLGDLLREDAQPGDPEGPADRDWLDDPDRSDELDEDLPEEELDPLEPGGPAIGGAWERALAVTVEEAETRALFESPLDLEDELEPTPADGPAAPRPVFGTPSPPPWYRSQVADLADLAQRLQLAGLALREAGGAAAGAEERLIALDAEVLRLGQFARTLGYLAAPPAAGQQQIALGVLVQEVLAGLVGAGRARFLYRGGQGPQVSSDKQLLVPVLDALMTVAGRCAGADGEVRVALSDGAGPVDLRVGFPAGPLAERTPAELLEPYAMRRELTDVGPNALAAARSILRGQGGNLVLEAVAPGRLEFALSLPV